MTKFKFKPTGRTYFISDTHFGHRNIIDMCGRPYKSVGEMDADLIASWNAIVAPGDTIWHLGDFGYGNREYLQGIFDRLNGFKHFVRGNHDKPWVNELGWESVHDLVTISVDGEAVTLCHYPLREWPRYWSEGLHLYGHVHSNLPGSRHSYDVGVDSIGKFPMKLGDIKKKMALRPDVQFAEGQPVDRRRKRELAVEDEPAIKP